MTAPVGRQVEFTPEVVETVLTPPDVDNEGAGGVGQDEEDEGWDEEVEEAHFEFDVRLWALMLECDIGLWWSGQD